MSCCGQCIPHCRGTKRILIVDDGSLSDRDSIVSIVRETYGDATCEVLFITSEEAKNYTDALVGIEEVKKNLERVITKKEMYETIKPDKSELRQKRQEYNNRQRFHNSRTRYRSRF